MREKIEKRTRELMKIIKQAEIDIKNAPEGSLKICGDKSRKQIYLNKDGQVKYLKKSEHIIARKIAQRDYATKIFSFAQKELKILIKLKKIMNENDLMSIYSSLHPIRQQLVTPYILPDDQFVARWQNQQYQRKGFKPDSPEIYSEKNERVRSKTEKFLADKFKLMNIPYHYEKPLYLKGYGIVHPDFTLLNVRTREEYFFEHLGMMDDLEYVENMITRFHWYEKNGIFIGEKLLISFETKSKPLNIQHITPIIEKYLL